MRSEMITTKQANHERYSASDFSIHSREEYMSFYMLILIRAQENDLISKAESNLIHHFLMAVAMERADDNAVILSNIFYILTFYLQSIGPVEALNELKSVKSESTAECLFNKINQYVKRYVSKNNTALTSVERLVRKTDNESISVSYDSLKTAICEILEYESSDEINLQEKHGKFIFGLLYAISYSPSEAEGYLNTVSNVIQSFVIEIKILNKLGGENYLRALTEQQGLFDYQKGLRTAEIEKKYTQKIQKLKEKKETEVKKLTKLLDKAVSEEKIYEIESRIDSIDVWYNEHLKKIEAEWEEAEEKEYKRESADEYASAQELFLFQASLPSLKEMIKSIAVYIKVHKGEADVNLSNPQELLTATESIPLDDAINEILQLKEKCGLTDFECGYLENLKMEG